MPRLLSLVLLPALVLSLLGCGRTPGTPDAAAPPAEASPAWTTLYLVRHAEKATDGTDDPLLTETGRTRAARLATLLADADLDAVYSTPYRRTEQTAAPTAQAAQLPVTRYDVQGSALADTLRSRHAGEDVLVVGHSNTIPQLLNALVGAEAYAQLAEQEYDALFVVTASADTADVALLRF